MKTCKIWKPTEDFRYVFILLQLGFMFGTSGFNICRNGTVTSARMASDKMPLIVTFTLFSKTANTQIYMSFSNLRSSEFCSTNLLHLVLLELNTNPTLSASLSYHCLSLFTRPSRLRNSLS